MRMPRLNLGLDDQQVITGLLRITDIFIVVGTAFTAFYLHHGFKQLPDHYYVAIALAALLTANFLHINQVYRFADLRRFSVQLGAITTGFIAIAVTLLLIAYFGKVSQNFSRVWATYWVISAFVSLLGLHAACALVIRNFYETGKLSYNIAIIGAGDPGARFYNHIMALKDSGIRVSGVFDDRVGRASAEIAEEHLKGTVDDLLLMMRTHRIDQVTIALPWSATERIRQMLDRIKTVATDVSLCPEAAAFELPNLGYANMGGVSVMTMLKPPLRGWSRILKGLEDRLLAALILLFIWPVLVVAAIAIKLDSRGPVIFKQRRYGFNNNEIIVYKLRTMEWQEAPDDSSVPQATRDDPRITRIGKFLRRTSLDELPQLLNVLSGEMSLVGPRPHAVAHNEEYAKIIDGYLVRHKVKPGIAGWAQVNGLRGETRSPDLMRQRVQHDLYYIENWSLRLDLKILVMTCFIGFSGENAY